MGGCLVSMAEKQQKHKQQMGTTLVARWSCLTVLHSVNVARLCHSVVIVRQKAVSLAHDVLTKVIELSKLILNVHDEGGLGLVGACSNRAAARCVCCDCRFVLPRILKG